MADIGENAAIFDWEGIGWIGGDETANGARIMTIDWEDEAVDGKNFFELFYSDAWLDANETLALVDIEEIIETFGRENNASRDGRTNFISAGATWSNAKCGSVFFG